MAQFSMISLLAIVLLTTTSEANAFITPSHRCHAAQRNLDPPALLKQTSLLHAKRPKRSNSGKGFGPEEKTFADQSYGSGGRPVIKDVIDVEGAMSSFFSSKEEWLPLFRSLASSSSSHPLPASEYLSGGTIGSPVEYFDSSPWKQLQALPTNEEQLSIISSFLDATQQSLVEIPVDERVSEDAADVHFIEEGRRILALSRFHVLSGRAGGISRHDELFATCWSELAELARVGAENSGSLIILPDYDMVDLRRFAEMNLHLPLDWLGVEKEVFEVSSLERGVAAIRIIHKLGDIPDPQELQEDL